VQQRMSRVLAAAEQGAVLTRGLTVAIAGRPNAGKSTLMNRLAGHDVAIVTPVAGTTRDVLRERIEMDGVPVELIDTAGLRDETGDAIESEGMRRAREAIARADHVLFVVDAAADPDASSFEAERSALPAGIPVTLVMNKCDLPAAKSAAESLLAAERRAAGSRAAGSSAADSPLRLAISATTGEGLSALRTLLVGTAGQSDAGPGAFSARARHVDALRRGAQHLALAHHHLQSRQGELAAFELRNAQKELGDVVGDVSSDELLGHIFGSFCIGK
jgi:tRNA modification GTPase